MTRLVLTFSCRSQQQQQQLQAQHSLPLLSLQNKTFGMPVKAHYSFHFTSIGENKSFVKSCFFSSWFNQNCINVANMNMTGTELGCFHIIILFSSGNKIQLVPYVNRASRRFTHKTAAFYFSVFENCVHVLISIYMYYALLRFQTGGAHTSLFQCLNADEWIVSVKFFT